ncbi:hypothetical protein [Enterococcus sp. LJL90]
MGWFDWLENSLVMFAALLLVVGLIIRTRKILWSKSEKFLLLLTVGFFCLDTLWWWQGWHFFWSDFDFQIGQDTFKLTIFFIGWLISYFSLLIKRLNRLKK